MDNEAFQRELQKYQVVRRKNYCRVQWNSTVGDEELSATRASEPRDIPKFDDSSAFWPAFERYLRVYYGPEGARKARAVAEKSHLDMLSGLNLEELDEIAELVT